MKPAIVIAFILLTSIGFAQDKKPYQLDRAKIELRLKQIEGKIQERQKQLMEADPIIRDLVGQYNGIVLALSDSVAVPDSTKKRTK